MLEVSNIRGLNGHAIEGWLVESSPRFALVVYQGQTLPNLDVTGLCRHQSTSHLKLSTRLSVGGFPMGSWLTMTKTGCADRP